MQAKTTTAQRLSRLADLYQQGQASELMDRTLDKLMTLEAQQSSEQLSELQADLVELEERYNMSSDEFYGLFQSGRTDDRMDFVEWASLVQMRDNLAQRVRLLTGEDAQ
jgi:phospholipase C